MDIRLAECSKSGAERAPSRDNSDMSASPVAQVGSSVWLQQSGGIIVKRRERWRFIRESYLDAPSLIVNRARAAHWKRRKPRTKLHPHLPTLPKSCLVDEAIATCQQTLSSNFFNHSMRTWVFGSALAAADDPDDPLDQNPLFFVAALFHDLGLASGTYNRCFTVAGASAAQALIGKDVANPDLREAASAISRHISPRLKKNEQLAFYLQRGSVLDLTGARVSRFSYDFVEAVYRKYPASRDANHEGSARWRAEAALVHHGRAQLLQTWGRFGCLVQRGALPLVIPATAAVAPAGPPHASYSADATSSGQGASKST